MAEMGSMHAQPGVVGKEVGRGGRPEAEDDEARIEAEDEWKKKEVEQVAEERLKLRNRKGEMLRKWVDG